MEARSVEREVARHANAAVTTSDESDLPFGSLVQERLEIARRLAGALLRNSDDAEDAVLDAVARAWEHRTELHDIARFDAWFDRILVNRCREMLRRRRVRAIEPGSPSEPSVSDQAVALGERDALRRALLGLDVDHRAIVVLRFIEDLPLAAIAERIGIPEGTVRSRLHYALRELRAAYEAAERLPGGGR